MLGRLSGPLREFIVFVGSYLTGITAVFTAAGFLAVRAHLVMLGLPSTTFDLESYVETGARFLAFLPIYLGLAVVVGLLDLVIGLLAFLAGLGGGVLLTVLLTTLLAWVAGVRWRRTRRAAARVRLAVRRRARAAVAALRDAGRRRRTTLLVLFLFVQFVGAYQLTQAVEVSDLLFRDAAHAGPLPSLSVVDTTRLVEWLQEGRVVPRMQYMGWLFLLTLLTGWGLHRMLQVVREGEGQAGFWLLTWCAVSAMLLVTQVTLLPVNYGVLLSGNQFPAVTVSLRPAEEAPEVPAERPPEREALALLRETGDGFYLYAADERRIWYVRRDDVLGLQYHGMIDVLAHPTHPPNRP